MNLKFKSKLFVLGMDKTKIFFYRNSQCFLTLERAYDNMRRFLYFKTSTEYNFLSLNPSQILVKPWKSLKILKFLKNESSIAYRFNTLHNNIYFILFNFIHRNILWYIWSIANTYINIHKNHTGWLDCSKLT